MKTRPARVGAGPDAAPTGTWYQIENKADGASIMLYDEIGAWGTPASAFVKELNNVKGSAIELHIHSPGGDVFDGMAIYDAIRNHPADVSVTVDGVAASAASFVAMAGDTITMAPRAELMIHEAHAISAGAAKDMTAMAQLLDRCSNKIASIYAERAGGTAEEWRDRMRTETWYSADEAVKAGLADQVAGPPAARPRNTWDLSIFNYGGRGAAPDPFGEAPPEPPPPTIEPATDPAPEPGFLLPALDPALLRDSIAAMQDIQFDPDVFRAAVALVANDAPAPDAPPKAAPAPPEPDLSIDLPAFRRSIREARL